MSGLRRTRLRATDLTQISLAHITHTVVAGLSIVLETALPPSSIVDT
jgi:hypothetical protein